MGKGFPFQGGLKAGGGIKNAPSILKFLEKQHQKKLTPSQASAYLANKLASVNQALTEEPKPASTLGDLLAQVEELDAAIEQANASLVGWGQWNYGITVSSNEAPTTTGKPSAPVVNGPVSTATASKFTFITPRMRVHPDMLRFLYLDGKFPDCVIKYKGLVHNNYYESNLASPDPNTRAVRATMREYGFTAPEVSAFIFANDGGLWTFSDFAKILRRLPVPHSMENTEERQKWTRGFVWRVVYEMMKVHNLLQIRVAYFDHHVHCFAEAKDILALIPNDTVPFPEISREALNASK